MIFERTIRRDSEPHQMIYPMPVDCIKVRRVALDGNRCKFNFDRETKNLGIYQMPGKKGKLEAAIVEERDGMF